MRTVQFIESVNISERLVYEGEEELRSSGFRYNVFRQISDAHAPLEMIAPIDQEVRVNIVPIHRMCEAFKKNDQPDFLGKNVYVRETFIAYSKEVEFYLQMPFNMMHRELKNCRASELIAHIDMKRAKANAREKSNCALVVGSDHCTKTILGINISGDDVVAI